VVKRGAAVIVAALLLSACDSQKTGDDATKPAVKSGVVFVEDKGDRKPRRRANTPKSCITKSAVVMCVGTDPAP
jgi:hypothetical protein